MFWCIYRPLPYPVVLSWLPFFCLLLALNQHHWALSCSNIKNSTAHKQTQMMIWVMNGWEKSHFHCTSCCIPMVNFTSLLSVMLIIAPACCQDWFPGLVYVALGCLTSHSQTVSGELQTRDGKILSPGAPCFSHDKCRVDLWWWKSWYYSCIWWWKLLRLRPSQHDPLSLFSTVSFTWLANKNSYFKKKALKKCFHNQKNTYFLIKTWFTHTKCV